MTVSVWGAFLLLALIANVLAQSDNIYRIHRGEKLELKFAPCPCVFSLFVSAQFGTTRVSVIDAENFFALSGGGDKVRYLHRTEIRYPIEASLQQQITGATEGLIFLLEALPSLSSYISSVYLIHDVRTAETLVPLELASNVFASKIPGPCPCLIALVPPTSGQDDGRTPSSFILDDAGTQRLLSGIIPDWTSVATSEVTTSGLHVISSSSRGQAVVIFVSHSHAQSPQRGWDMTSKAVILTTAAPEVLSATPGLTSAPSAVFITGRSLGSPNDTLAVFLGGRVCSNPRVVHPTFRIQCEAAAGHGSRLNVEVIVNGMSSGKSGEGIFRYLDLLLPPAFVINLDKDVSRWDIISARLRFFGFDPRRLSAAEELTLTVEELEFLHMDQPQRFRTAVENVIAVSHFRAWQRIIAENMRGAFVFEDDVWLAPNFLEQFGTCLNERSMWDDDLVFVGWCYHPFHAHFTRNTCWIAAPSYCTQAYYVSFRGAQRLTSIFTDGWCAFPLDKCITRTWLRIQNSLTASEVEEGGLEGGPKELNVWTMTSGRGHDGDFLDDGLFGGGLVLQDRLRLRTTRNDVAL